MRQHVHAIKIVHMAKNGDIIIADLCGTTAINPSAENHLANVYWCFVSRAFTGLFRRLASPSVAAVAEPKLVVEPIQYWGETINSINKQAGMKTDSTCFAVASNQFFCVLGKMLYIGLTCLWSVPLVPWVKGAADTSPNYCGLHLTKYFINWSYWHHSCIMTFSI